MDDYAALIDRITRGKRFLVASHFNPDGDGIGSTLALGLCLDRLGKEVVLYNQDPLPQTLAFLPGSGCIVQALPPGAIFDLSIMVDCAQQKRISEAFVSFPGRGAIACIDHHQLESAEAELTLIDSEAASTGEVVLRLARRMGIAMDHRIAQCIYTTLVVDTGFYRYSNTDAHILSLAAELVSAGALPWDVAKNLEESYPASRMKLLGMALGSLSLSHGGRYAAMDVTQEMLRSSGASIEHSDEFAVYPRAIAGVEVSALFREVGDGRVKVSLRSKDSVDVAALAQGFGGGGHARAAGFQMRATMEEARRRVEEAVGKALEYPGTLVR